MKEAIQLANSSVNYANYDWDGDGYVDQVYVIYAGKGEADGGDDDTIWPHAWDLYSATGSYLTLDGVKINSYACGGELDGQTGEIAGIGTMCHEFSHCLGFPDFYDIDYSSDKRADAWGMDEWDLMCSGSYNGDGYTPCGYTAYERWMAGWKTPIELKSTTSVTGMKGLTDGGESYVIYNTGNSNEYFMLENRSKSSWDAPLSGHGMLIVHVDYDATVWSNNGPNDDPDHQRMTWIPADNEFQYAKYSSGTYYLTSTGLSTDTYPTTSNTTFGPSSTPKATWFNSNAEGNKWMEYTISNITKSSTGLISFNFQGLSNVATPTFSPVAGKYTEAQSVTISCETTGATIYYTTDGNDPTTSSSVYTTPINVAETTTLKAMAVKDGEQSAIATATFKIGAATGDDFKLVTKTTELVSGEDYIIACGSKARAAGAMNSSYLSSETVEVDDNIVTKTDDVLVFTATQTSSGWTFYNEDKGYLYATDVKKLAWDSSAKYWTLSDGTAGVVMTYGSYGTMLYNVDSPRFTTYTSSPSAKMIQANLYKAISSTPVVTIPAPILSPAGGEVAAGTKVTITNDNADYLYFYTTDGTDPDCDSELDPTGTSQVYDASTGIVVNAAMTVKAIAVDIELNKSSITTAAYTLPVVVEQLADPVFSPAAGTYSSAQSVTITCATTGATIYYTTNSTTPTASSTKYTGAITISANTTLKAIALKDGATSSNVVTAEYVIKTSSGGGSGSGIFERVESIADLEGGKNYLLVYDGGSTNPTSASAYSGIGGSGTSTYGNVKQNITVTNKQIDNNEAGAKVVVLEQNGTNWYIKDGDNYLAYTGTSTSSNNYLYSVSSASTNGTLWTISISSNEATIKNVYNTSRTLRYNTSSPRIAGYNGTNNLELLEIYKEVGGSSTPIVLSDKLLFKKVSSVTPGKRYLIVYNLDGTLKAQNPYSGTGTYGYLYAKTTVEDNGGVIECTNTADIFTFESASGGFYIKDSSGRYHYQTTGYNNFNLSTGKPTSNGIWSATANASGLFTIKNNGTSKWIQYNTTYSSTGAYSSAQSTGVLPYLYEEVQAVDVPVGGTTYASLYYGTKNLQVPAGVKAYAYIVNSQGQLEKSHTYNAGDVIPAGTGVIVEAETQTYQFILSSESGTTPAANMLHGSDAEEETTGGAIYFKLSLNAAEEPGTVGFYYGAAAGGAFTNGAHKAYLAVPASVADAIHVQGYPFADETTGISTVDELTSKQVNESAVYTLDGRKVNLSPEGGAGGGLPKGTYIVRQSDGTVRKVMVK